MAGDDYIIEFAVTYPDTVTIAPVNSTAINVGGRPLSVKITEYVEMFPAGLVFNTTVSVWDDALDEAADVTITAGLAGLECTISLVGAATEITGTLSMSAPVGEFSFLVFIPITFTC